MITANRIKKAVEEYRSADGHREHAVLRERLYDLVDEMQDRCEVAEREAAKYRLFLSGEVRIDFGRDPGFYVKMKNRAGKYYLESAELDADLDDFIESQFPERSPS